RRSACQAIAAELSPGSPLLCMGNVNGEPVRFIIDIGAIWSTLDASWARAHKLALSRTPMRLMGQGDIGSHEMQMTIVQELELGELKFERIYFGVTSLEAWGLAKRGKWMPDTNGLLGADLLAANGALIDFASLKLWLRKPKPSK